jgi:hypothetical protein
MATAKPAKQKKVPKILLSDMLNALDRRDKGWYNRLDDEQKKEFSPWLVMRYASSVSGENYIQEHYLTAINQLVNVNFGSLGKEHNELHWLCMQAVGVGMSQTHPFVKPPKRGSANKLFAWLAKRHPEFSDEEIELMMDSNSIASFKELAAQLGLSPHEIGNIFE